MAIDITTAPNMNASDSPVEPTVKVATMRGVTTRRRLDRFWQMIRDESSVMFPYESGTYNISDELDLKLVVVDIMKPSSDPILRESDVSIFPKYRFDMKLVESDPLDLGGMGIATPYDYIPPKSEKSTGSFV